MIARPRIWPYAAAFVVVAIVWTIFVMARHYSYWQTTGQEMPQMGSSIRNGVLAVLALAALAYGASVAWLHRSPVATAATSDRPVPGSQESGAVVTHGFNGSRTMLSRTGQRYVLEVRGMGIVVGEYADEEIWREIEKKADNHASYVSANPEDYPDSDDIRMADLRVSTTLSFKEGGRHAVEYWPVPTIVWGPPKDKGNSFRAAKSIADGRQQASLGVTLFLWEADANTSDGAAMIDKLFAFFDSHPDVPAALVVSQDGSMLRSLLVAPGSGGPSSAGHVVPDLPDSMGAILVSRSDRVDKLIRPYAVEQTAQINRNSTEYDIIRLWNFFWEQNDDRGPDSFTAHYLEQEKRAGVLYPGAIGVMSSTWWQAKLPEFWKTIDNKGPGQFTPTPYIPVRWTTWQVKQFDDAPLLGYLHRPVDVKLTDDHGQPLKTAAQAAALKAGWEQAVATLPDGKEPKRVFYDTTGDRLWAVPLNQALAQVGTAAPSLSDVKDGYDIGARIGNTGVSSPLVQIGLALIAGYQDGGASATVNRRPNGTASIIMISPPDATSKAAWAQANNGANPFK
ncbi:DUF2875 family protein [Burkholderia multivorans]|uniref:type VI lipase adapter Tla3 domain-containing protein n=1 Tax=Burkholderia multivorans TaxID=87883 RepID=UPI000CFEDB89|nr:DUF2875 family protein [Burkholderia multivorans]MBU9184691.1 DUF2875 family protein [Burkholderia multivorans]MBU9335691.1 DUF2875 family protein [Burkholderia multivorans]MBU9368939.1 DUF2875 family protein [Burkholderia multivorans]MCL4662193.1 DUF2875 family protein [Burkholderia multivorans]MCO1353631.1 DUF2875 family protein [Burkholderia multivorans]